MDITIVSVGKLKEKYLKKGVKIILVGSVENNNYTNKEGVKVYSTVINANEIEFAESKGSADRSEDAGCTGTKPDKKDDGFMNIPTGLEEELPFM
jgi:single-strand DNA-binding protein